jgi:hypothetical protein
MLIWVVSEGVEHSKGGSQSGPKDVPQDDRQDVSRSSSQRGPEEGSHSCPLEVMQDNQQFHRMNQQHHPSIIQQS